MIKSFLLLSLHHKCATKLPFWPFGIKLLRFTYNYPFQLIDILAGSNLADIRSRSENMFLTNLIESDSWTGGLLEVGFYFVI